MLPFRNQRKEQRLRQEVRFSGFHIRYEKKYQEMQLALARSAPVDKFATECGEATVYSGFGGESGRKRASEGDFDDPKIWTGLPCALITEVR